MGACVMNYIKKIPYIILIIILQLNSCMFFPQDDKDEKQSLSEYSKTVLSDFMDSIKSINTSSRSSVAYANLTKAELNIMQSDIESALLSTGNGTSSDLELIMRTIAESAELSLASQSREDTKILNIKAISKASLLAIGKNRGGISITKRKEIVSSVSEALIGNITNTDISASSIPITTDYIVKIIIGSLNSVSVSTSNIDDFSAYISSKSAIAISNNSGLSEEILKKALAKTSSSALKAVEDIDGLSLTNSIRGNITRAITGAVSDTLGDIKEKLSFSVDMTIVLDYITTESINTVVDIQQGIYGVNIDEDYLLQLKKDIIAESVESIIKIEVDSSTYVNSFENLLLKKLTELNISESDIKQAIAAGEINALENQNISPEEQVRLAKNLLEVGSWNQAYIKFSEIIDSDETIPDEAYLWWAALEIANITVSTEIKSIASKLGFIDYPESIESFFAEEFTNGQIIEELDWNNVDYQGNPGIITNYLPRVNGSDKFIAVDGDIQENSMLSMEEYFLAIVSNLITSYPDGLNEFYDTLLGASDRLDNVISKLKLLPDNLVISLSFEMFNNIAYSIDSGWPSGEVTTAGEPVQPAEINIGKAEISTLTAILEVIRMAGYMGKSLSLTADLDGFWNAFNPLNGTAYNFSSDGRVISIRSDFAWSSLNNPFSQGLLHARSDAQTSMSIANNYFIGFLTNLKSATVSIRSRDTQSQFFLSPSNSDLAAQWGMLASILDTTSILCSKMITSLGSTSSYPIYIPEIPFNGTDIDMENFFNKYSIESQWPITSGIDTITVDLHFFKNPFFTIDNLIELTGTTKEPVIYTYAVPFKPISITDFTNSTNTTVFYIKVKDITLGGLLPEMAIYLTSKVPTDFYIEGSSIFIPIPSESSPAVGHSIYSSGTSFNYLGVSYVSSGSFFTGLLIDG